MGITHFDEAPTRVRHAGHIRASWTMLGQAAGSVTVGVRRIQVAEGDWTTPVHAHGRDEEFFYVLAGRGLWWEEPGQAWPIGEGDCVFAKPSGRGHTIQAGEGGLDVLVYGHRNQDEGVQFFRLGMSFVGTRLVPSDPGVIDGLPAQFVREAELGPPPLPDIQEQRRPKHIVNLVDLEPEGWDSPRIAMRERHFGDFFGSRRSGLVHVTVPPGKFGAPQHCHSAEEEIFVVLDGDGAAVWGDGEEAPVRPGSVLAYPAGTGVAHHLRAGDAGLTYLAYGTRDPNDLCWYPRSKKIAFRGLKVIVRVEPVDYIDGEL